MWLAETCRILRVAFRTLVADRPLTIFVVTIVAVAFGGAAAIYSVADAVLVRALPFPEPHDLIAISEQRTGHDEPGPIATVDFLEWRNDRETFDGVAAVVDVSVTLKGTNGNEPEVIRAQHISYELLSVLRVSPLLGRDFTPDDESGATDTVAIISYGLWQRRFGGARDVIGRKLPGQRVDFEVVGVMPPSFAFPVGSPRITEAWLPYIVPAEERAAPSPFNYLHLIGRLGKEASIEQARTRVNQARVSAATTGSTIAVYPLHEFLIGHARRWMLLLLMAVAVVAAIAAANVVNLVLVKSSTRLREFNVQAALGQTVQALCAQLLLENLILCSVGGVFAIVVTMATTSILTAAIPAHVPMAAHIGVNSRVIAFACGLCGLLALLCTAAVTLDFRRARDKQSGAWSNRSAGPERRAVRWREGLLLAQIAMAALLLVGSALFLNSFLRVVRIDLGMTVDDLLTVRVRPPVNAANLPDARANNRRRLLSVLDSAMNTPGVESAALIAGGLPLRGDTNVKRVVLPASGEAFEFEVCDVSEGYFATLKIALQEGRLFVAGDDAGSERVAIVNKAAAALYFRGAPIGSIIDAGGPWRVVGVVANVRSDGPEHAPRPQVYFPLRQQPAIGATLIVRTTQAEAAIPVLKHQIRAEFADLALPDITMLGEFLGAMVGQRRFNMLLLSMFGFLAALIATIGVYSVVSYSVEKRSSEIGIRLCLGAHPRQIVGSVLRKTGGIAACGISVGLVGTWMIGAALNVFLFEVEGREIQVYVQAASVLIVAALAAAALPAIRASRIDPLTSIRADGAHR